MTEKEIIGKNIALCRKKLGLTQLEFSERLNYSDKAVSKWECGESVPDIILLKQIADMSGVSLDYFLEEEHNSDKKTIDSKHDTYAHLIISLLSVAFIWLIATMIYAIIKMSIDMTIIEIFVYTVPITCIVLLVFNSIWGKSWMNYIIISALIWSILVCIYNLLYSLNISNVWLIYVLGAPAEVIVILWSFLHLRKQKRNNNC